MSSEALNAEVQEGIQEFGTTAFDLIELLLQHSRELRAELEEKDRKLEELRAALPLNRVGEEWA